MLLNYTLQKWQISHFYVPNSQNVLSDWSNWFFPFRLTNIENICLKPNNIQIYFRHCPSWNCHRQFWRNGILYAEFISLSKVTSYSWQSSRDKLLRFYSYSLIREFVLEVVKVLRVYKTTSLFIKKLQSEERPVCDFRQYIVENVHNCTQQGDLQWLLCRPCLLHEVFFYCTSVVFFSTSAFQLVMTCTRPSIFLQYYTLHLR